MGVFMLTKKVVEEFVLKLAVDLLFLGGIVVFTSLCLAMFGYVLRRQWLQRLLKLVFLLGYFCCLLKLCVTGCLFIWNYDFSGFDLTELKPQPRRWRLVMHGMFLCFGLAVLLSYEECLLKKLEWRRYYVVLVAHDLFVVCLVYWFLTEEIFTPYDLTVKNFQGWWTAVQKEYHKFYLITMFAGVEYGAKLLYYDFKNLPQKKWDDRQELVLSESAFVRRCRFYAACLVLELIPLVVTLLEIFMWRFL